MTASDPTPDEGEQRLDDTMVWVQTLLRESVPSGFLDSCEAASRDGFMLLKLRQEDRRRPAAAWQPAPAYLKALVAGARVSLEAVVRWARLPADLGLTREFGAGWGRLTRALGWDPAASLLRLRLAFAEEAGDFVLPLARRGGAGPGGGRTASDPSAVLAALAASTAGWDPLIRDRLRECEDDFREECGLV
jgi:hypothetical protein